jgi:hypothetical protein
MKAKLTLLFTFGILFTQAQFIDQISIYPPNPTSNDQVYFIAKCYFSSGTCNQKTQNISIAGNQIYASALHCIGMLTYICDETDSFYIGNLPQGTYHVNFQLDAGAGPLPCTPGIVAGPSDSLTFTVQNATGLSSLENQVLVVSPNPTREKAQIRISGEFTNSTLEIRDITGAKVIEIHPDKASIEVDLKNLPAGVYQAVFLTRTEAKSAVKILKID